MKKLVFFFIVCACILSCAYGHCDWDTVEGYITGYSYNIADTGGFTFWVYETPEADTAPSYIYVADGSIYEQCLKALLTAASCDNARVFAFGAVVTPSNYSTIEAVEASRVTVYIDPDTEPVISANIVDTAPNRHLPNPNN